MNIKKILLTTSLMISIMLMSTVSLQASQRPPISMGVFVDHAKGKPTASIAASSTDQSTTYKYNGVHWATPNVTYRVNQASSGLDPSATLAAVQSGFNTWENELNPFGLPDLSLINYEYSPSPVSTTGRAKRDGQNNISWGRLSSGAIAVTYYWYNTNTLELVEFDMIFNKRLPWSANGSSNTFDVQNITTHEAGHTLVLLDLYDPIDSELTMYGYGALGETKKRDLGMGDMLGVEKIYPAP